jgi:hypothetical protein
VTWSSGIISVGQKGDWSLWVARSNPSEYRVATVYFKNIVKAKKAYYVGIHICTLLRVF